MKNLKIILSFVLFFLLIPIALLLGFCIYTWRMAMVIAFVLERNDDQTAKWIKDSEL